MFIQIILILTLVLSYVVPFGYYRIKVKLRGKANAKVAFLINGILFLGTLVITSTILFNHTILAANIAGTGETAAANALASGSNVDSWRYVAAALSTGLSCIGAGVAVASAASAALGALSENPGIMGKALIFVALAESIALYGVLISFSLLSA